MRSDWNFLLRKLGRSAGSTLKLCIIPLKSSFVRYSKQDDDDDDDDDDDHDDDEDDDDDDDDDAPCQHDS